MTVACDEGKEIDEKEEKRKEEILKLFKEFKTETEKRQVSSSENFDKSILTYSSWALGISIAFLKDFIPITLAELPYLLYASWVLFTFSIVITTISFLLSYKGLELSLSYAVEYYLHENEDYFNKENIYNKFVKNMNWASGISFILGLFSTLVFVTANLEKSVMVKKIVVGQDGLPTSLMNKIPQKNIDTSRGLNAPAMQQIPKPVAPPLPVKPTVPQSK